MSQENVEAVRRTCEAFLAGDIPTALDMLDPQVEWHGTVGGLDEGQLYRGHDAVIGAFAENFESWEQLTLEAQRYLDAGDSVVVFWHETARSRHSDVELTTETGVIYTLRDGKIVEVRGFMDRERALKAAGLEETT